MKNNGLWVLSYYNMFRQVVFLRSPVENCTRIKYILIIIATFYKDREQLKNECVYFTFYVLDSRLSRTLWTAGYRFVICCMDIVKCRILSFELFEENQQRRLIKSFMYLRTLRTSIEFHSIDLARKIMGIVYYYTHG